MEILSIVAYFVKNSKIQLTKGRLNKLVYLADWKFSLDYNKQISKINWKFNHYGPYVDDIENSIVNDSLNRFEIVADTTYFGSQKYIIKMKQDLNFSLPNNEEKRVLDLIIELTDELNWTDFINLVYSTYPIKVTSRGDIMDLVKLSKEYKNTKR
ncbi:Panacea domain-containing protein [Helicobacter sp. MIT 05-5294]|uniref:Panacea domain-containing protein n=1 Tax=Helicobacter sp. MIT 05-5294 TaxID=1548150 RepID=UPI00051F8B15|nr:Panacea domain-containing protein [Helicobacter sp. MIT 05-5294]TLD85759.1 DUF4065 domain-containing protein [Helicobacter sp. MIT 05-5294]